jgi:NAD(P)-dependent dehydrogenase (short-subunit alcohol dehydrogenase family)
MNNKTIFITGGNTGIGLATALLFAKEGANVAILSRRRDENAAARAKIEKLGVKALDFAGDVPTRQPFAPRSPKQPRRLADYTSLSTTPGSNRSRPLWSSRLWRTTGASST